MSKFHYCSSEDELLWYLQIDPFNQRAYPFVQMSSNELGNQRYNIKCWIEQNCIGEVVIWNGVSTPFVGDTSWRNKTMPTGNATIYFTDERDATLFTLRWVQKEQHESK